MRLIVREFLKRLRGINESCRKANKEECMRPKQTHRASRSAAASMWPSSMDDPADEWLLLVSCICGYVLLRCAGMMMKINGLRKADCLGRPQ